MMCLAHITLKVSRQIKKKPHDGADFKAMYLHHQVRSGPERSHRACYHAGRTAFPLAPPRSPLVLVATLAGWHMWLVPTLAAWLHEQLVATLAGWHLWLVPTLAGWLHEQRGLMRPWH